MADHGEVFTPPEIVDAMLNLVQAETERIDSRFLEPACGTGNFLVPVLQRKLGAVDAHYRRSPFERHHYALLALMSIYGIELLADNVAECRQNLLGVFTGALAVGSGSELGTAAQVVLDLNIVHGDALAMTTAEQPTRPITFAEWAYRGKGEYYRRDFRFEAMTQAASFGGDDTLFAELGQHEIFKPAKDYGRLSVAEIAGGWHG